MCPSDNTVSWYFRKKLANRYFLYANRGQKEADQPETAAAEETAAVEQAAATEAAAEAEQCKKLTMNPLDLSRVWRGQSDSEIVENVKRVK